jgi:hypothetical protein
MRHHKAHHRRGYKPSAATVARQAKEVAHYKKKWVQAQRKLAHSVGARLAKAHGHWRFVS